MNRTRIEIGPLHIDQTEHTTRASFHTASNSEISSFEFKIPGDETANVTLDFIEGDVRLSVFLRPDDIERLGEVVDTLRNQDAEES